MRDKVQKPTAMVLMRHESDFSDEYSEVTKQSFEEYYSKNGWVLVGDAERQEIEAKAAQEAVTGEPHPVEAPEPEDSPKTSRKAESETSKEK